MEHKQKAASNTAQELAARRRRSPGHQPFNPDGTLKINKTGKKKGGDRKVYPRRTDFADHIG